MRCPVGREYDGDESRRCRRVDSDRAQHPEASKSGAGQSHRTRHSLDVLDSSIELLVSDFAPFEEEVLQDGPKNGETIDYARFEPY